MKNNERLIYGITITVIIYFISTIFGKYINPNFEFFSKTFGTHTIMLLLSILVIYLLKKNIEYKISFPQFKTIFKPILYGILANILVNGIFTAIMKKVFGIHIEGMEILKEMKLSHIIFFVFLYASIAEELLFRGFLLNFLKPLSKKKITIFKKMISVPVIISAIMFGLAHLILIKSGASPQLIIRTIIFTTTLGIIAGYYQEKYGNNAYAIIVHMSANSLAIVGSIFMSLNN